MPTIPMTHRPVIQPAPGFQPGPMLPPVTSSRTPANRIPTRDESGGWFEDAMFGALDNVLYGLHATGLAKPTVNLALNLAAGGNKPNWYEGVSEHAATMLAAEYKERPNRKSFAERTR